MAEMLRMRTGQPPADGWKIPRAALFLGVSERTLERYVAQRMVPCFAYPPARVEEERSPDARPKKGEKPIIVFDPVELAAWRDQFHIGPRMRKVG